MNRAIYLAPKGQTHYCNWEKPVLSKHRINRVVPQFKGAVYAWLRSIELSRHPFPMKCLSRSATRLTVFAPNATNATLRSFSRVLSFMLEFPRWESYEETSPVNIGRCRRFGLALNVSPGTARFRQLSGAFRKPYARREP
jgi:hypothetical protein